MKTHTIVLSLVGLLAVALVAIFAYTSGQQNPSSNDDILTPANVVRVINEARQGRNLPTIVVDKAFQDGAELQSSSNGKLGTVSPSTDNFFNTRFETKSGDHYSAQGFVLTLPESFVYGSYTKIGVGVSYVASETLGAVPYISIIIR